MRLLVLIVAFVGILGTAQLVIFARTAWHALAFLIATFLQMCVLFAHLRLSFFAILYLIIYVGALMVLFLFIIMMVDRSYLEGGVRRLNATAGSFLFFFLLYFIHTLVSTDMNLNNLADLAAMISTIQDIRIELYLLFGSSQFITLGVVLYRCFPILLFLVAYLFFITMIGAILICYDPQTKIKRPLSSQQTARTPHNSIRLFDLNKFLGK